jgi:hypothetical protein
MPDLDCSSVSNLTAGDDQKIYLKIFGNMEKINSSLHCKTKSYNSTQ